MAGMSPSLFAATKEQFTIYGAPAMPSVTIAVAAAQGEISQTSGCRIRDLAFALINLRAGVASGSI